jgi:hypothetical protein
MRRHRALAAQAAVICRAVTPKLAVAVASGLGYMATFPESGHEYRLPRSRGPTRDAMVAPRALYALVIWNANQTRELAPIHRAGQGR